MNKSVIDIEGKKYEVRRNHNKTHPCAGCSFFDGEFSNCPNNIPCLDFDDNSKYYHILKRIQ